MAVLLLLFILVTVLFPEDDTAAADSTTPQYESTVEIQLELTDSTEPIESTESTELTYPSENPSTQARNEAATDDVLILSMVDVGQADAFVLEYEGMVTVIDSGEDANCEALMNYLNERGITEIDLLFGSHPHEDHIGGMVTLITNYEVGTVYLPEAEGIGSDCYDELQEELYEGDYNVQYIKEGDVYYMGDVTITVLEQFEPPLDEVNNYSAIMKITLGEMDVIMTGDAETKVEKELLRSGQDISAEVLKVGHHGSNTSTSTAFLDAVNPTYALISCGLANKHKHPTEKIMERLESRGIIVYRTDECGTVVLTITPTDITFNCEPGDYLSGTELKEKVGNAS